MNSKELKKRPSGHNGGRKPICLCGCCRVCKQRLVNQNFRRREKGLKILDISDEELEKRLVAKFRKEGWDANE